jgi:Fe-Mn family superoxide dismutase
VTTLVKTPRQAWGSYTELNSKPTGEKIMMTRRQAIKTSALASAALATLPGAIAQTNSAAPVAAMTNGPFTLPPLPYAYEALEPFIDVETMHIHHDKHHAAYVANLNKAVAKYPDLGKMPVEDLLKDLNAIPEKIRTAVRNQGGGHYNHSLFWQMLKKDGGGPKSALAAAIDRQFGSFSTFKTEWTKAAISQFGSGWTWLVVDADKKLSIEPTANQDSPISQGKQQLLGIDVWEHAYYLQYQNRRPEYVTAFFNVINWDFVSERYQQFVS